MLDTGKVINVKYTINKWADIFYIERNVMQKTKSIKVIISVIITAAIFYLVQRLITVKDIAGIFGKIPAYSLVGGVMLYFLSYTFRSLRYGTLLNGKKIRLSDLINISFIHGFFNKVIPLRIGEASFVYLLGKRHGVAAEESVSVIFLCRIYDTLICVIFLFFFSFFVTSIGSGSEGIRILCVILVIMLLLSVVFIRRFIRIAAMCIDFIVSALPKKLGGPFAKVSGILSTVSVYLKNITTKEIIIKTLLFSSLNWLSIFIFYYVLIKGMKYGVKFLEMCYGTALANLANIVPVSAFGGIGSTDAGFAAGLALTGKNMKQALTVSISVSLFQLLCIILFSAIGYIGIKVSEPKGGKIQDQDLV